MPELNSALVADVVAACRTGAGEIAQALSRVLDTTLTVEVGAAATFDPIDTADELAGPGLAVMLNVGNAAALAMLPESNGLVPAWCAAPDVTGTSRLTTLAQEFSFLLLPDTLAVEEFLTEWVDDLSAALGRGMPAGDASIVPLKLTTADGRTATLYYVFPCTAGDQIFPLPQIGLPATEVPREKPAGVLRGEEAQQAVARAVTQRAAAARSMLTLEELPNYTKSLLRIKVPVMVTLATKKQPVATILELGPGVILQFKKSCDQLLELEVNGHSIGLGEAVKVGDKFGLRVTSLTLPGERFQPLGKVS